MSMNNDNDFRVLSTWHIKNDADLSSIRKYSDWFVNADYGYLDTIEIGRVLFTHTGHNGEFTLGMERIIALFYALNCQAIVTCFPARHYHKHPELAKELNILYPDINDRTANDWSELQTNRITRIGVET